MAEDDAKEQGLPSTEDLLAAYRARRARAEAPREAPAEADAQRPGPPPADDARPGPPAKTPFRDPGPGGAADSDRSPAAAPERPEGTGKAAQGVEGQRSAGEARGTGSAPSPPPSAPSPPPSAPSPSPPPGGGEDPPPVPAAGGARIAAPDGGFPLGPGAPDLGLRASLREHALLAPHGNRSGRVLGVLLMLGGLVLAAWERRERLLGRSPPGAAGLGLLEAAAVLVGLGGLLALLSLFLPWRRRVRMRLLRHQEDEWVRVAALAVRHRILSWAGAVALLGGAALVVVAYHGGQSTSLAAGGAVLSLAGALVLIAVTARRDVLRRLYVQTLLLAWLERSGIATPGGGLDDTRVRHVLKALDRLLGSLSEDDVRRFMATPEADDYLQLLGEVRAEEDARA